MDTEEGKTGKPFIIANPVYDTVFKRLMENHRVAKFILGTILEQQIEDFTVMPQEFTYKLGLTKTPDTDKAGYKETAGESKYYRISRLDFMATVRTEGSQVIKRYPYNPEDENMKLITGILHEMGVDPDESKLIEEEEESLRYIEDINCEQEALKKALEEKAKTIEEQTREIEELKRLLREKREE